jgi:Zn-dependent peptidase ImmA (M78 family)
LAVFYLPEPPLDFQALSDFRRLPDAEDAKFSPELRSAIRRARFQQDAMVELSEVTGERLADAPRVATSHDDPEAFAQSAREIIGVSLDVQREWPNEGRALNGWIGALEELDVLVLHAQGVALKEMRGFSISASKAPVIVLNGSDSARGRIFTLLHEFAHILLNNAGVCDLHERSAGSPTDDLEVFCNRVAAAILLPAEQFTAEPRLANPPASGRWDDTDLRALSETYSVSQEVVLRRLFGLGLTTWDFLQEKRREYLDAYLEQKKRESAGSGGPSWYRIHVRDFGRVYIKTALEAYYRSEITSSELSDYVEVKLNKLPKLEEELSKGSAA